MGGSKEADQGAGSSARRRVLVIDDEPAVARMLKLLLEQYDVEIAPSGAAALARLAEEPGFDVVICDLSMPVMTGMDVHEQITRERPDLARKFVFMTGGAYTERAITFLENNTNPRLPKPFKVEELEGAIARILDGS
jgi:CheY-like chemotaxis protein